MKTLTSAAIIALFMFGITIYLALDNNLTTSKFGIYTIYYTNGKTERIVTKSKLSLQKEGCVWSPEEARYVACYVQKMTIELDK